MPDAEELAAFREYMRRQNRSVDDLPDEAAERLLYFAFWRLAQARDRLRLAIRRMLPW